ncbi:imm11 family protein [Sphingomonas lacusdianchii]|uniref:imm11 family protein n=1 Tax=Sphingomonas lacusdianchii TaxID=2917992 RepID=UPI001F592E72|nr:DUF1629 domain-containing protein [Sphingomonas sp. JXJ CY 53]
MILPDRVIEVPGTGLLPPVYEPQIPARMHEDERVRVIPPSAPWGVRNAADVSAPFDNVASKDQRYWFLRDAYERELPHGLEWAERPAPGRWGDGLGLDLLANGTTFRFSAPASRIKLPSMWEPFGGVAMVVSRRLLDVLSALDAGAIVSRTLVIRGQDNELVSDEYAIVDVVRNLAAIDIANSIIDYHGPSGGHPPHLSGYVSSRIRDDLGEEIAIFRQRSFASNGGRMVIVNAKVRQALNSASPRFSNMRFDVCG